MYPCWTSSLISLLILSRPNSPSFIRAGTDISQSSGLANKDTAIPFAAKERLVFKSNSFDMEVQLFFFAFFNINLSIYFSLLIFKNLKYLLIHNLYPMAQ